MKKVLPYVLVAFGGYLIGLYEYKYKVTNALLKAWSDAEKFKKEDKHEQKKSS